MPARCVAFDGVIDDLPNVRELSKQAWVGARHYSTYPVTSKALFSLFTSQYPPELWSRDNYRFQGHVVSSLMDNLKAAGYQTAVYGSSTSLFPAMQGALEDLGFRRIQRTDEGPGSRIWAGLGIQDPWFLDFSVKRDKQSWVTHERELDLLALKQLTTDMDSWIRSNTRYAAVFLPQISHGPWGDLLSNGREANLLNRCRTLAEEQDRWLGSIRALLKERGRLSKTLIVVTGDHGVRSIVDDPAFPRGTTNDYSFHVPLLLYAPGVLHSTSILHWVTSHIDLGPSVLDLLGISRDTDYEQGMPLWDARIQQRITYFIAYPYHPDDGYYSQGRFFSWNRMLETTYQNDQLEFGFNNIIPRTSALHDRISQNLRALDEVRSRCLKVSEHFYATSISADRSSTHRKD